MEFRYAGGDARTYRVPVWQYGMRHDGSGTSGWRYSGLDRLFAEHLALPDLPLATADAALRLGPPQSAGSVLADGPAPTHSTMASSIVGIPANSMDERCWVAYMFLLRQYC